MKRRHLIYVVIVALMAPQLASALPRDPDLFSADRPVEDLIQTFDVLAADDTAKSTAEPLMAGRTYSFVVTGMFNPNQTGRKADAGFYSDDNFSTSSGCRQNGTGILVNGVNYGALNSGLICDRFGHKYSITHKPLVNSSPSFKIADLDGSRANNSGQLTVKVYLQRYVTWTLRLDRPIGVFGQEELVVDATSSSPVTATPPILVPLPALPRVTPDLAFQIKSTNPNPNDPNSPCPRNVSVVLWVDGVANETPLINCVPREADFFNPVVLAAGAVGGTPAQDFQVYGSQPLPLRHAVAIPPELRSGSKIVVTFSWRADVSKLVNVASTTGGNDVWAPFGVNDAMWFANPINLASVGGSISVVPYRPDGTPLLGRTETYPGLGQILEAMFASRVGGK